jgi:hypothetical protein
MKSNFTLKFVKNNFLVNLLWWIADNQFTNRFSTWWSYLSNVVLKIIGSVLTYNAVIGAKYLLPWDFSPLLGALASNLWIGGNSFKIFERLF